MTPTSALAVLALAIGIIAGPALLPAEPGFRRGDFNQSGEVDISDSIAILDFLFNGTSRTSCLDAADANDDELVDISDTIALIGWLFQGSTPPPSPGPFTCGVDPTPGDGEADLGCQTGCSTPLKTTIKLAWNAVTLDTDGNPETLSGYRIYVARAPGAFGSPMAMVGTNAATIEVKESGTWRIAVSAYDLAGNESEFSNPIEVVVP